MGHDLDRYGQRVFAREHIAARAASAVIFPFLDSNLHAGNRTIVTRLATESVCKTLHRLRVEP
jgi:hypothetical protein